MPHIQSAQSHCHFPVVIQKDLKYVLYRGQERLVQPQKYSDVPLRPKCVSFIDETKNQGKHDCVEQQHIGAILTLVSPVRENQDNDEDEHRQQPVVDAEYCVEQNTRLVFRMDKSVEIQHGVIEIAHDVDDDEVDGVALRIFEVDQLEGLMVESGGSAVNVAYPQQLDDYCF